MSSNFKFYSLGGSGEVGMNSLVFQFGKTLLPVDAGVVFADNNDYGIESVHADYEEFFKNNDVRHWIITHAHEDHIGAVAAVISGALRACKNVPKIYAPIFAAELIREKVLEDTRYAKAHEHISCIVDVEPDSEWVLDGVRVRFIENRHSTLQCCSIAFESYIDSVPIRVLHTSDFKIDTSVYPDGAKNLSIFDVFSGERPDFVFMDSTNSERDGHTISENEVLPNLQNLIQKQEGRVFVSMFSSNVYRFSALFSLAEKMGRKVCLAGRGFNNAHRVATERGLYARYCLPFPQGALYSSSELAKLPRAQQLIICSGSQGESRSVLMRLSQGTHSEYKIQEGDTVILSSKTIPGNEKPISRLINGLLRQGARVYWGEYGKIQAGGPIHGSGHARRDEIRQVLHYLRPKNVIPVHGELRQLKSCAELAVECGQSWNMPAENVHVVENLNELIFSHNGHEWVLQDKAQHLYQGRMLRFEQFVCQSLDPFLKVRKRAAQGGVLSLVMDSAGRFKFHSSGILPTSNGHEKHLNSLDKLIEDWAETQYKWLAREAKFYEDSLDPIEDELSEDLARTIRRGMGVRPYVTVHLVKL